jgi:hypothetical protein
MSAQTELPSQLMDQGVHMNPNADECNLQAMIEIGAHSVAPFRECTRVREAPQKNFSMVVWQELDTLVISTLQYRLSFQ